MLKPVKAGGFFLIVMLITSCQAYNNFRAYYNTFYNAKKSYKQGLKKVQNQPEAINAEQFISLYSAAANAGKADFEKAIGNAAQILHRFPDSKWLDDALFLIGKSYYFLNDYYSALEKFEAVIAINHSTNLKQQAILWKARILAELNLPKKGVQFLKGQLTTNQ